jgi:hypothetical protein
MCARTATLELKTLRETLAQQYQDLRRLTEDLLGANQSLDPDLIAAKASEVRQPKESIDAVRQVLPPRKEVILALDTILGVPLADNTTTSSAAGTSTAQIHRKAGDPEDLELLCDRNARTLVEDNLRTALFKMGEELSRMMREKVVDVVHPAVIAAAPNGLAAGMLRFYGSFDLFDSVQFPMMFGTDVTEADSVEIMRIAPQDAGRLNKTLEERKTKVKGILLAHFGAFLDEHWRENDLLWGRLDAAERIITVLLPWDESKRFREQLIDEAQHEIVVEFGVQSTLRKLILEQAREAGADGQLTDENVQKVVDAVNVPLPLSSPDQFRTMQIMDAWSAGVPASMKPRAAIQTAARSSTIIGHILEAISGSKGTKLPAKILINTGRALWGLVEVSAPRSAGVLFGQYFISLLFLIEVILIVGGTFLAPGVPQLGWTLFGITLLVWLIRRTLWSYMRGPKVVRQFLAGVLTAVIVLVAFLIGLGALKTGDFITILCPRRLGL